MKICISSTRDHENAIADRRFGRCPYYAIYDDQNKTYDYMDNGAIAETHGAGLKAAQSIVDAGVEVVITGQVGPNAMEVLEAGKIGIYEMQGNKVNEQIQYLQAGKLKKMIAAGAPHEGMGRNGFSHKG